MMKKTKYKYDAAKYDKSIHKIETRDGKEVEIIKDDVQSEFPLIGIIKNQDGTEEVVTYTEDGMFFSQDTYHESENDLFMTHTEYEEGDIVVLSWQDGTKGCVWIGILKWVERTFDEEEEESYSAACYADIAENTNGPEVSARRLNYDDSYYSADNIRLATNKEVEILFNALAEDGKKWDADKKEIVPIEKEDAKIAQVREYEPIGKIYRDGNKEIVINKEMTMEELKRILIIVSEELSKCVR